MPQTADHIPSRWIRQCESTACLLLICGPMLFFANASGMQERNVVFLLAYICGTAVLAMLIDARGSGRFRLAILGILLLFALLWMARFRAYDPLGPVDAKVFFDGAEAVRKNQTPYVGLNLGFPPVYALCAILGDSFDVFLRNLLLIDSVSSISSIVVVAAACFICYVRREKESIRKAEILFLTVIATLVFYHFFRWNRGYGNFCTILALLVIFIMVAHYFSKPLLTGLSLGIAISLKPYFLSLAAGYFIHLVVKRRKASLIVLAGVFLVLAGTALLLQLAEGGLGLDTYFQFFGGTSRESIPGMLFNVENISAWASLQYFLRTLGISHHSYQITAFTLSLSLIFYGFGLAICVKERISDMKMDHVVYYLLLTTAIYPLLWQRYFSWIIAPAVYALCEISSNQESEKLMPSFLLCCLVLTFPTIAWIGGVALPILFLIHIVQKQRIDFEPRAFSNDICCKA